MNAPESWWVLSMSASCLYVLLVGTEHQPFFLERLHFLQAKPRLLLGIMTLHLPLLLALCALGASVWLTEQSFNVWLTNLEEFKKPIGVLLSLQALYFLLHGRVFGTWVLLLACTLTLQLWLYYQTLGIDFQTLGQAYAAVLFVMLLIINIALHAIHKNIKLAFARPLAALLLIAQYAFSTTAIPGSSVVGFDWIKVDTILFPFGLMLLFVLAGYIKQSWLTHITRTARL